MEAGTQRTMELEVEPSISGALSGNIKVTYEDASGKVYQADPMAFEVFVAEQFVTEPEVPGKGEEVPGMGEEVIPPAGMPVWAWIAIPVAVGLLITAVILIARKRRKKVEQEYEMQ
jgi:hypothetical protein